MFFFLILQIFQQIFALFFTSTNKEYPNTNKGGAITATPLLIK